MRISGSDGAPPPVGVKDQSSGKAQWIWLLVGAVMALTGGGIKVYDIMTSPAVFEYVFFSGASYVLMIAGFVLVVIALGYEALFGGGLTGE